MAVIADGIDPDEPAVHARELLAHFREEFAYAVRVLNESPDSGKRRDAAVMAATLGNLWYYATTGVRRAESDAERVKGFVASLYGEVMEGS